jgi:tRNA (adenine37-N6)-methyltransferase
MNEIVMRPIGVVRGTRSEVVDDHWSAERCAIELDAAQFSADALAGLADFSHALIVFHMHGVDESRIESGARHPRNNSAWPKVGIFAQRAKLRPNRIGVTVCRILAVEGLQVRVEDLDAIDGTPVLDIKPWVKEFAPRGETHQPQWIGELMKDYF